MISLKKVTTLNKVDAEGFTLIELLVSIVIIGVLSSIALPSYLNQAVKARTSEAKMVLGQINRAQQAYRIERGNFASNLINLDTQLSTKYFEYVVSAGASDFATATSIRNSSGYIADDLPAFSSAISKEADDTMKTIICKTPNPSSTPPNIISTASCPGTSIEVR
jgi:type IV pilus assembly protein PilA